MTTPRKIHGVDISHHQAGNIGWAALKRAGVQWMYHKATEGSGFKDNNYSKRRAEAHAAGMPFGGYHFARPSVGDARQEARFFISVLQPKPGDLVPCLDLEVNEGLSMDRIKTWADEFCDEVERLTGVTPLVYTPYVLSSSLERKALFWVPRYNNSNTPPVRQWDIWQFSNGQFGVPNEVPGLGHVDLNTFGVGVGLKDIQIPVVKVPTSKGANVDEAEARLKAAAKRAKAGTLRAKLIARAQAALAKIKPTK